MKEKRLLLTVPVLCLYLAACGGSQSSPVSSSSNLTPEGEALAVAAVQPAGGATRQAGTDTTESIETHQSASVSKMVAKHVVRSVTDMLSGEDYQPVKGVSYKEEGDKVILTLTYSNESVTMSGDSFKLSSGSSFTLSGGIVAKMPKKVTAGSSYTIDISTTGDGLKITFENMQGELTIDNNNYQVTLNGTMALVVEGGSITFTLNESMDVSSVDYNVECSVSGSNLTVQGDVNGTINNVDVAISVKGEVADVNAEPTPSCSGFVEVTPKDASKQTCAITEDCNGCKPPAG